MFQSATATPEDILPLSTQSEGGRAAKWLRAGTVTCIFMLTLCAPHSIAATQIAWSFGLLFWVASFVVRPHPKLYRTPVDYALVAFFILTFVSAIFSYDVIVSLGKLRGASLFTIAYLVAENVLSRRMVRSLAIALIASCMINVVFTLAQRARGRGVKVEELSAESPLKIAGMQNGDTILEVNGKELRNPTTLDQALATRGPDSGTPVQVKIYRYEWTHTLEIAPGQLLQGATALSRLGIGSWSQGRDWRATGFYDHYVTYAEVLQLIMSLAMGLFLAVKNKWSRNGLLLGLAIALMGLAMLLTVTRGSWLALLISAFTILIASRSGKRALIMLAILSTLLAAAGLYELRQKRNVGFIDQSDGSITWRETVYREGLQLLLSKPRHLVVGVGMDSIKRYWRQWGLFENGRLPIGHMHNTPLELALERGIPAMLSWLVFLAVYARMLWRLARTEPSATAGTDKYPSGSAPGAGSWIERGVILGALGGLVGFFTSGLFQYNLGDSEVAMIFYLIAGLALATERLTRNALRGSKTG